MNSIKAYYFAPSNNRLSYGDGRQIRIGRTHKVKGKLKLCGKGLHASLHPFDALEYAPYDTKYLYEVELSGDIIKGEDKLCASERTYLKKIKVEDVLRKFARQCALDVIHLWNAPDVVIKYLKTGDESLRDAARDAAKAADSAARAAAARAANTAARAAAWAANTAAWAATAAARAASDTAWAATAAANAAANDAAWTARAAANAAAWAANTAAWATNTAAWATSDAARAAAIKKQQARFKRMVTKEFKK